MFDDILQPKKKHFFDGGYFTIDISDIDYKWDKGDFTIEYWVKFNGDDWARIIKEIKNGGYVEFVDE